MIEIKGYRKNKGTTMTQELRRLAICPTPSQPFQTTCEAVTEDKKKGCSGGKKEF